MQRRCLSRRMRLDYGSRCLDLVVVDAWYTNGPFLKEVFEELGWPVLAVLKQECREVHQEVMALTRGQPPTLEVEREDRHVAIREVKGLSLTNNYPRPVRVIRVQERWVERHRVGGEWTQHWHLTHCAHHHPVAVVVLLWIKLIAFTLFHAFAILHGKRLRLGLATMSELRKQLYRSLLCGQPILFFSG